MGLSFLCAWVFHGTGQKVSGPILVHFMFNLPIGSLFPLELQAYWL
jgi:membrane protease YdiL (CAAX protease family)